MVTAAQAGITRRSSGPHSGCMPMGNANCVDPCSKITCGAGFQCVSGSCVDCHQFGCPSGQICVGTPGMCQTDPCTNVVCPANEFCDSTGNWTRCPSGFSS